MKKLHTFFNTLDDPVETLQTEDRRAHNKNVGDILVENLLTMVLYHATLLVH